MDFRLVFWFSQKHTNQFRPVSSALSGFFFSTIDKVNFGQLLFLQFNYGAPSIRTFVILIIRGCIGRSKWASSAVWTFSQMSKYEHFFESFTDFLLNYYYLHFLLFNCWKIFVFKSSFFIEFLNHLISILWHRMVIERKVARIIELELILCVILLTSAKQGRYEVCYCTERPN